MDRYVAKALSYLKCIVVPYSVALHYQQTKSVRSLKEVMTGLLKMKELSDPQLVTLIIEVDSIY